MIGMDTSDLRIGNLVYVNIYKRYCQVDEIFKDCIRSSDNVFLNNEISGIELSEELLERFGVKKDWHNYLFPGIDGVYLCGDDSEMNLDKVPICGDYDACVFIKMPEYVHQLQNLFFVLKGEELKYKL
jgi:hypothetical protein